MKNKTNIPKATLGVLTQPQDCTHAYTNINLVTCKDIMIYLLLVKDVLVIENQLCHSYKKNHV